MPLNAPRLPDHFEPVLSTEAMREADRRTMEEARLPGRVLMETAGRGAADAVEQHYGSVRDRRVVVLCGKGNNGGDGFVIARVLHARGAEVQAVALAEADALPEDAAANLRLLQAIAQHDDRLRVEATARPDGLNAHWPHLIVDALLGIGVTGALREPFDAFARWMNESLAPTIALDVPSGLDSETGQAADGAVRAELTVTMGALKPGLLFADGPEHAGRVEVVDIGIPPHLLAEAVAAPGSARRSTDAAVQRLLPTRASDAHKYSAGRVFAICGSRAFPGAAALTASSAARAGAGAVVLAVPESARDILETKLTEIMTEAMPETEDGTLSGDAFSRLLERAEKADAVVIGPGLGRHPDTQSLIRRLLARLSTPAVLDADALNALSGHTDLLRRHADGRFVLTPHLGELRRLAEGDDLDTERRLALAAEYAERWNSVLVVKGMPSVVGTPEGRVLVSGAVSPALATAGTGDVLAGMTVGLLAQGLPPAEAALCALHLGGRAAERYAEQADVRSMMASDLLGLFPCVFPT